MKQLNYKYWADYIYDLIDVYPVKVNSVLELGAGSGNVSRYLKKKFKNYIITDKSFPMLSRSETGFTRCICDMSALPFKKEFDVIFSIFDSVNYITERDRFIKFLTECRKFLTAKGILVFDVSLLNNSINNLKQLNRSGSYNGIKYKQVSLVDEERQIHKNILEIVINGDTFVETHIQKIYDFAEYFEFADKAGLKVLDALDCFTFDDADSNSERVQFVLEKR